MDEVPACTLDVREHADALKLCKTYGGRLPTATVPDALGNLGEASALALIGGLGP